MKTIPITGYYPQPQILARLPEGSLQQLQSAISSKASLAVRHNAFTDYCLALLFCSTGHRAVSDPFCELSLFDLERGLLLISDKVTAEDRAWHLVALPDIAVKQVQNYLKYLEGLASKLYFSSGSKSLGKQVGSLLRGRTSVPLFFYLPEGCDAWEHVLPGTMALRWKEYWQLPVNFLRHVMADPLLDLTRRADWVSVQLGHSEGVDHPFGVTSTRSALETLAQIRPHLNTILKSLGWRPETLRLYGARVREVPSTPNTSSLFGYRLREAERKGRQQRIADFVKPLLNQYFSGDAAVNVESILQLSQQIISEAPSKGCSVNRSLELLYRHIRRSSGGTDLMRQLPRIRQIEIEASPFSATTLVSYQQAQDVRESFLAYLHRQGQSCSAVNLPTRIAEIMASAALFGGVTSVERLDLLGECLPSRTYMLERQPFVDLPLGKGEATFRWLPDPMSRRLIFGLFRSGVERVSLSVGQVRKAVAALLLSVTGERVSRPIEWLARHGAAAQVLEVPGYITACCRGEIPAVALPLQHWVRVATGRALIAPDKTSIDSNAADDFWTPVTVSSDEALRTKGEAQAFLRELGGYISAARQTELSGNTLAHTRSKAALVQLIEKASTNAQWATLPAMLAAWAVHLCQYGTRQTRNLAYSTIEKYVSFVASSLLPVAVGEHMAACDEVAYEELYLRAITREKPSRRYELASRLLELHRFLMDAYLLGELDSSALMAAAGGQAEASLADANYLTSAEYRCALQALVKASGLGAKRWQYAGLLLLGYRFGLRFGEALRLRYTDVQRSGEVVCVWIHHSAYGETKTRSGVRVVPLVERLETLENEVLDRLLAPCDELFESNPGVMLMAMELGETGLLGRSQAARVLNGLLRRITGDASIRFHHLRHGWVSRAVAAQAGLQLPGTTERLAAHACEEFFGGESGYPLLSITVSAGHVHERTTLGSYVHGIDQLAQTYYPDPALSDFAASYAEHVAYATVRTRRRSGGRSLQGRLPDIPQPAVLTKRLGSAGLESLFTPSLDAAERPSLVEIDFLLRRYRDSGRQLGVVADRLGLDEIQAQGVLASALNAEIRSGYDGYGLALRSPDPLIRSASGRGVQQFVRESTFVRDELAVVQKQLESLSISDQTAVRDGVIAWLTTVDAASGECMVSSLEQLAAIVRLGLFLGVRLDASIPPKVDSAQIRQQLTLLGVEYEALNLARAEHLRLQLTPGKGARRSLQRLLLVIASSLTPLSL